MVSCLGTVVCVLTRTSYKYYEIVPTHRALYHIRNYIVIFFISVCMVATPPSPSPPPDSGAIIVKVSLRPVHTSVKSSVQCNFEYDKEHGELALFHSTCIV
jgi:hypothetical protein